MSEKHHRDDAHMRSCVVRTTFFCTIPYLRSCISEKVKAWLLHSRGKHFRPEPRKTAFSSWGVINRGKAKLRLKAVQDSVSITNTGVNHRPGPLTGPWGALHSWELQRFSAGMLVTVFADRHLKYHLGMTFSQTWPIKNKRSTVQHRRCLPKTISDTFSSDTSGPYLILVDKL